MDQTMLDLSFKGERKYLTGADLYDQTLTWLQSAQPDAPIEQVDFAFHRFASHRVLASTGDPTAQQEAFATCRFSQAGRRKEAYLIETQDTVSARRPFPEDEIVAPMHFDLSARTGRLVARTDFSDIEVAVAMTKALHQQVFAQRAGKWIFVRGRFARYTRRTEARDRVVRIAASFNDRLTRSELALDGRPVGEIHFSIV